MSSWKRGAIALLVCTACGTTVPTAGQAGATNGDLSAAPQSTALAQAGGQVTGPTPSAQLPGTDGSAAGGSASTSTGSEATPSDGGTRSTSLTVPGVKPGQVLIGYDTSSAVSGLALSIGLNGVDPGNTDAQVRAVVDDLNAHGGLVGHKVVLKKFDVTANSTAQEMCAAWTQDAHVFAAVDSVNAAAPVLDSTVADCLAKKRVPLLTGAPLISQLAYDRYPYLVAPAHAAAERYMRGLVEQLTQTDYFHGWDNALGQSSVSPVKIGVMSFDNPGDQSRATALRNALKAHGYGDVDIVKNSSDISQIAAATQSAVLRFKAEGVTHVFGANVLFYQDAQSQGYHPRYAVDDSANTVQLMAQDAPKAQLHGSVGAGYLPLSEDDAFTPTNPAARRCLGLMQKAGLDTTNRFAVTYMLGICDRFWTLERALRASGTLSSAGFLAGLTKLPAASDSAATYALTLSARRHDGAYRLRGFSYVDSCTCFRLTRVLSDF